VDDDGESIYGMAWPALVFGAAAGWQAGESDVDQFKNSYDGLLTAVATRPSATRWRTWIADTKALPRLTSIPRPTICSGPIRFTPEGAKLMQKILPAARICDWARSTHWNRYTEIR